MWKAADNFFGGVGGWAYFKYVFSHGVVSCWLDGIISGQNQTLVLSRYISLLQLTYARASATLWPFRVCAEATAESTSFTNGGLG